MHSSSVNAAIILLLAQVVVAGCHGFDPPPQTPLLVANTAPVYFDPGMQGGAGPVFAEPIAPGGIPNFPDPLAPAGPVAFAPPPLGESGGAIAPEFGLPGAEVITPGLPNPLKVPVGNHDFAWDQIVDVVSTYFPIAREERVRIDSQMWTEGRVETPYQVGATLLEPHRKDTVGTFNLWQSTLQTIRRRAVVRVVPEPDGYLVDVQVDRELEDLPRPEQATAGAASIRSDGSLPSAARGEVSRTGWSPDWIPLGRDIPLEQEMLAEIQERLAATPRVPMSITPTW